MRRKYGRKHGSLMDQMPEIIIVSIFCIGIMIGSLFANQLCKPGRNQIEEVEKLVENFIVNININNVPKGYLFTSALITYGKQMLLIWLFGLFAMTTPLIGLLVGMLGFSYGFTTSFFMIQYSLKGFLICFAAYGIQGALFAGIVFLLSMESIEYSRKRKTINFKIYMVYLLVALLLTIVLALVEAYIAPILIQQTITTFFE